MIYNTFLRVMILLLACTMTNQVSAQQGTVVKWVVEKNSTLCVEGQSNINSFNCSIDKYLNNDTIVVMGDNAKPVRLSGDLQMNVMAFECANALIIKDLRKTLKAETYPMLTIRFLTLHCMPTFKSECENIKGWVEVELAGTVKRFEIQYSFTKKSNCTIQLNGSSNFCFSDFNLSPPRKLAGLIRIKDDFAVNFQLLLRTVKA